MPNPIVHWEITGKDKAALQDFYRQAFGWNIDSGNPMGYGMTDTGGEGINGGIDGDEPGVIVYVQVPDPQAHLAKLEGMGARVIMPVTVIPGMVTMAKFQDPAGNIVGIVGPEPPPAG